MRIYNILAIETSTDRLSLAILLGDRMFVREVDAGQRHSELALPMMYALLDEAEELRGQRFAVTAIELAG